MIDRASILAWNEQAPWTDLAMVEQDLIISCALYISVRRVVTSSTFRWLSKAGNWT